MLLLAAIVALNSTTTMPIPPPEKGIEAVSWSVRGISHTLRVRSDDDAGLKLIDRPHEFLRSVVGPMVSTLMDHAWVAENDGGYRTLKIVTEYQGEYQFDLIGFLDETGQSGRVLAQLLTQQTCLLDGACTVASPAWPERPHCPSANSIAAWDGGFVELANLLVSAQCFSSEAVRIEPEAFWIESFDGTTMTMAVQRDHCDAARSACGGGYSRIELAPPQQWMGWLEDANAGRGFLPVQRPTTSHAAELPPVGNALGIPAPEAADTVGG